jgi:PilZ domain-containing protein
MITNPVRYERRAAQRFDYQLPISVKFQGQEGEQAGFTQNLSARGVFFYSDCAIVEGASIELTVLMPAEITLTDNMRVRCRGKVLRVVQCNGSSKIGVAAQLEGYEYLPDAAGVGTEGSFARISALHDHHEMEDRGTLSPLELTVKESSSRS